MVSDIQQNKNNLKVLIVEDNRMFAELLNETIGVYYKKHISPNGKDAIEIFEVIKHDIVFLDINLPDMSGYDVLESLKKIKPDVYVVVVTGSPTKDNVEKAVFNSVKGFLSKPFSRNQIVDHLERATVFFGIK